MHQFLCLSERGGNFLKFALERGVPKKEGGGGGGEEGGSNPGGNDAF